MKLFAKALYNDKERLDWLEKQIGPHGLSILRFGPDVQTDDDATYAHYPGGPAEVQRFRKKFRAACGAQVGDLHIGYAVGKTVRDVLDDALRRGQDTPRVPVDWRDRSPA
jgi:hypothetical protein